MIQKISILGCGWLGLPLGISLVQKGWDVKGSTTNETKFVTMKDNGIKPFLINLTPDYTGGATEITEFLSSDLLIVNIPPAIHKHGHEYHVQQVQSLSAYIKKSSIKYVLYISATSVYPDLNREVVEYDVSTVKEAANKTLFIAEEIFRNQREVKSLILRCAGLAGYDRNLVKHFAGKINLKMGNAPVNLIHRDDVIQIIEALIDYNRWNQTYNLSAPVHPLRKDLYPYLATLYHYSMPQYDLSDSSSFKIINAGKLEREIHYQFKFPDPHFFYYNQ